MQTLTPAKPLPPEHRDRVIKAESGDKTHVVQLDMAAGHASAEHHQEQLGSGPALSRSPY